MRDHAECLFKFQDPAKKLTAVSWRVVWGQKMCDPFLEGAPGYDPFAKSRDTFLSNSEFVPILTELIMRVGVDLTSAQELP